MRDSVLSRIASTPLSFPYFDVDALKAVEPMDARFKASLFEITDKAFSEYGFDMDRVPEIILAQYQASKYISQKMDSMGMSDAHASRLSGIARSMLSKCANGKRPFSPGAAVVTPFCYNVMNESCNKVLLGYTGQIVLPSVYAETAKALEVIPEERRESLLKKAKVQMALYERQNPSEIKNAPHRDLSVLIGERIFELINDNGTNGYLLFGQETPYGVRNFLRQFINDEFKRESPRIGHLMYLAFESEMALDYYVAEDFTKYTPCYYRQGEELVQVTDRSILQYIGICSSVNVERRIVLVGEAMGAALTQKVST
jgi:hypothetical protein